MNAPPGTDWQPGGNISVSLSDRNSTDGVELRAYWAESSADGTVITPFKKQVWGEEFGMCTDKSGVNWMVNVTAD